MFKAKYIFETKRTRLQRYLKNSSVLLVVMFFAYIIFGVIIIVYANKQNDLSKATFFKRPPDLIVVFTGDQGRIPYAFKLSKELRRPQIFITGVHEKNSVETLISQIKPYSDFNPDMLAIDYGASNTVENVIVTLKHLRKYDELSNILIVSHDYHILRIKLIMNEIKSSNDKYHFYYSGKQSEIFNIRNLKILYKEVFKVIRTYIFLLLWNP